MTFEGLDGAGKTTQSGMLGEYIKGTGREALILREPGGAAISEKIRGVILDRGNGKMEDMTEVLLYAAARAQLVREIIFPALERGAVVICDRFLDSSAAYQGFGRNIPLGAIYEINAYATGGLAPDITFFIDMRPKDSIMRRNGTTPDRIEAEALSFHERVYGGYEFLCDREPGRIKRIDGNLSAGKVHEAVVRELERFNV